MAADLFAGAGGASSGLVDACGDLGVDLDLVAVNHWDLAIATHKLNHPDHADRAHCAPVETLDPREAVPGGKLDLLIAAPECTHFSQARGGRPVNDQKRASPFHILRWLDILRVDVVLIENVSQLLSWGPCDVQGRPIKSKKGETFRAFVAMLEAMNYRVEWRVLNAADYGEAQSRRRLFIQCRRHRTGGPMRWPEPTHSQHGGDDLLRTTEPWRPAREIIDWSLEGKSIFTRKTPLRPKTLARIAAGARRYWGIDLEPFLVQYNGTGGARSVDEPIPTITTKDRLGLVEPFIVPFYGERKGQEPRTRSIDDPLQAVTSNPIGVCEPFLMSLTHGGRTHDVGEPLPTVTCANRGEMGVVEPFLVELRNNQDAASLDDPLSTVCTSGAHHALCEPFVLSQASGGAARPVGLPIPTIATSGAHSLIEPVQAGEALLDIRFRMLQPHELAAAQGFHPGYEFKGTKGDIVKQIGNAISVKTMRALCREELAETVLGRAA